MTTVLTLPTHVLQPHIILYGFSIMIQKQLFCVFQLFQTFLSKKKLERIRKSYSFSKNDLKHEIGFGKKFASEGVEAAYIARTFFKSYSYLKSYVWLLLVAVTLPVTSASCEKNFSKMKLVKTFPRNSMTSERLGNTDLLSGERYELKNRFRWFRWWIWQSTWQSKD